MQELLSNLGEALRPVEPRDAQQAAPEPASEPADAGEPKDSVAQQQPSPEAGQERSAALKEASESSAPEASDARGAEGAGEKPPLDVQSAPSAAEKLEQEIAATAEQVYRHTNPVQTCIDQCKMPVQPFPVHARAVTSMRPAMMGTSGLACASQVRKEEAGKSSSVPQQQAADAEVSTSYRGTIRYKHAQSESPDGVSMCSHSC